MLIPSSDCKGIRWPALPDEATAMVLALQHQLEQSEWWPPETLVAAQFRQLEALLAHAARTVPFHRERVRALANLQPGELTPEMWRRLPITRRGDIQAAGSALVSRWPPEDHGPVVDVRTSGSTGRPVEIQATRITKLVHSAVNLRYHLWHGRDLAAKAASIRYLRGKRAEIAAAGESSHWVAGYPSGQTHFFSITKPISEQLDWLVRLDPKYLLTFPSNLAALLRRSEDTGARPARLRGAWSMAEVLEPALRATCERVWGVPVSDTYSAVEVGPIALQCPNHPHHHVQAENVLVEVLGEDGTPCRPGAWGRVVVTALHNFATPLIRYEIGDLAEVGEACPCGRGLPVLTRILGRVRNLLTLPNGEQIRPWFRPVLGEIAAIREYQLIQRSVDALELRLVVARPLTTAEEDKIRDTIARNFEHPVTLRLAYLDEIPRTAGGKLEDVLSEVER